MIVESDLLELEFLDLYIPQDERKCEQSDKEAEFQ